MKQTSSNKESTRASIDRFLYYGPTFLVAVADLYLRAFMNKTVMVNPVPVPTVNKTFAKRAVAADPDITTIYFLHCHGLPRRCAATGNLPTMNNHVSKRKSRH